MFATTLEFQKERNVFAREYTGNMYGVVSYYMSKLLLELPLLFVLPLLELTLTFWAIGYRPGSFGKMLIV